MATTVVKTIGSTGDYTTIAAWVAAIPANLVAANEIWRGELLNELFSVAGEVFNIAGKTVDSTRYIELTTADGCSVFDDVNVRLNPLGKSPTSGARIVCTAGAGYMARCSVAYTRLSKLHMVSNLASGLVTSGLNMDINRIFAWSKSVVGGQGSLTMENGGVVRNSVIVHNGAVAGNPVARLLYGASAYNCTFIGTGTAKTAGISTQYGSTPAVFKNCYIRGAVSPIVDATIASTKINCFADTVVSGYGLAAYSTSTFYDVTLNAEDFRLVSGSALIDAGATEATYAASDISGLARVATYDVGAWEFESAGGSDATISATTSLPSFSGSAHVSPVASCTATTALPVFSGVLSSGEASFTTDASTTLPTFSGSVTGDTSSARITISDLKDLTTGTLRANETGITAIVNNITTGALVAMLPGQTSSAGGDISLVHISFVAGTQYRVTIILSDGSEGTWKYTAA